MHVISSAIPLSILSDLQPLPPPRVVYQNRIGSAKHREALKCGSLGFYDDFDFSTDFNVRP